MSEDCECYICTEPGGIKSPCGCKDLFIHKKCLLKMVNKSGKNQCSVCLSNFNNVVLNVKNKKQCKTEGVVAALAFIAFTVTISSLIMVLYCDISKVPYLFAITCFLTLFTGGFFFFWIRFVYKNRLNLMENVSIYTSSYVEQTSELSVI